MCRFAMAIVSVDHSAPGGKEPRRILEQGLLTIERRVLCAIGIITNEEVKRPEDNTEPAVTEDLEREL